MIFSCRTTTALLLAAVAVLAGPAPTARAVSPPTPRPTASPTPTVSAADVQRALARQQEALAQERARLGTATATATALLQAYQKAQRAADRTARAARTEAARLVEAKRLTVLSKARLQAYAGALYRTGMVDSRMFMLASAVTATDKQHFLSDLRLAQYIGGSQSNALDAFGRAQTAQDVAAARSRAAAQAQRVATARAATAKAAADRVVADAVQRVALRRQAVALTHAALADAQHREAMLAQAERIARLRSRPPELAIQGALVPRPKATCKGKDLSGFTNGMLPSDALCPLWGTYQQMLRADAAAAFNAMSHDYAVQFGQPICVTDSYRSYAEQLILAKAKPDLAATPGYSQHGWGVATDLCDGIESFGTTTHQWMLDNSMRFGWFHPDWAEPTGSKPEAWHWEFAG